MGPLKTH